MSKPIALVTVFVLISFVLIAATSVSVRGWLGGASQTVGVHAVNGLQTDFNHQRSTASEVESLQAQQQLQEFQQIQPGKSQQGGGGCRSESQTNPNDL
ncbi:MAG: hypothetical protein JW730_18705 [Anaerolineales bacterium]|nr:hypothetical protein [Anaerolineales bacterium]